MNPVQFDEIIQFWFGANADDAMVAKEKSALWWAKNPEMDGAIRQRFETHVVKAAIGELAAWESDPRGRLALILLTDQFPRSIYRDSPRAFAHDAKALAWCRNGIDHSLDMRLRPIERVFFYLPLEHAEALEQQNQSVEHFRRLLDSVGAELKEVFTEYLDFAGRHRDIIERFGRFPHRNKILGRESTPEESTFLNQPGSSF